MIIIKLIRVIVKFLPPHMRTSSKFVIQSMFNRLFGTNFQPSKKLNPEYYYQNSKHLINKRIIVSVKLSQRLNNT